MNTTTPQHHNTTEATPPRFIPGRGKYFVADITSTSTGTRLSMLLLNTTAGITVVDTGERFTTAILEGGATIGNGLAGIIIHAKRIKTE